VALVGGRIATASPLNPVWIAVGANVAARGIEGMISLAKDNFFTASGYKRARLPKGALVKRIVVPLNESEDRDVVKAYKQVGSADSFRYIYR
jgi:xanthine dehydrogenase iron-sulfur cluster and FAD-binding subunit A